MHVALPVNILVGHNLAASLYACQVALATRSVLKEEQARGTGPPHFVEYFLKRVATGKEQQQHGNIGLGWIFFHSPFCLILMSLR